MNEMTLQDLISGIELPLIRESHEIRKDFLDASFRDIFEVGTIPTMAEHQHRLYHYAKIRSSTSNIEFFVNVNNLEATRNNIVSESEKIKRYMLENTSNVVFTGIYTDTSPRNDKDVFYWHEFNNKAVNLTKRWMNRVGALVGGGIPASVTAILAYHDNPTYGHFFNVSQQTFFWTAGGFLVAGGALGNLHYKIRKFLGHPIKEFKRTRPILGVERIVKERVELDEGFDEYKPIHEGYGQPGTNYGGQSDSYHLNDTKEIPVKLNEWSKANPNNPLFCVEIGDDRNASPVIGSAELKIKVDGLEFQVRKISSYGYHTKIERKPRIDSRYFAIFRA